MGNPELLETKVMVDEITQCSLLINKVFRNLILW